MTNPAGCSGWELLQKLGQTSRKGHTTFCKELDQHLPELQARHAELYGHLEDWEERFGEWLLVIASAYLGRGQDLKKRDLAKANEGNWFLSNQLAGMSLYVDRFAKNLKGVSHKLDYLEELGINFIHLMPLFESPEGASDGGYAVSDFRKVDPRFGSLEDLRSLRKTMHARGMNLMLDIVLNHTSDQHAWALRAKAGEKAYQDYYYLYDNRWIPNQYEAAMPEIFPESSPGNFTWNEDCQKWVMTVFHSYQWDLNFRNPFVFNEMLATIFFYANEGVDLLRIDAPAFIWKETGTTSQNLPQAHQLLQLIKLAVKLATPGMAILGEAIVAPEFILDYFGRGAQAGKECDFAYNATQMALQWDMLATGDTRVMLQGQGILSQKPPGCSWISYVRCHDDIGLGYDDWMIQQAGKDPYLHRNFLKEYYSGTFPHSPARGALFSSNPKTGDARISGTLASLCGLEAATWAQDPHQIQTAIQKIILMQAFSIFQGGLPMLFSGDELGYLNDYSYEQDPGKSYDNRWMHRPRMDWEKANRRKVNGSIEQRIFSAIQRLLAIRKSLPVLADTETVHWIQTDTSQVAGFIRVLEGQQVLVIGNFSLQGVTLGRDVFQQSGFDSSSIWDHWAGAAFNPGSNAGYLTLESYEFRVLEAMG